MIKNKNYVYGEGHYEVPAHINFGKTMLDRLWQFRDRVAVINAETNDSLTYGELAQQAVNIALTLARHGIGKGQVASICSEKRMEFLPTVLGIMCSGATYSPADVTCGRATLLHRVGIVKPTIMFCSPKGWEALKGTLQSVDCLKTFVVYTDKPLDGAITFNEFVTEKAEVTQFIPADVNGWEDVAIVQYSSGTTGMPKGIQHTHLNYLGIMHSAFDFKHHEGKTLLNTREWYYTYGLNVTLAYLIFGGTVVYVACNTERYFLEAIQKYKIQVLQLAPASITELIKSSILSQYDVTSVERIMSASTVLDGASAAAVRKRFPNLTGVYQVYGMTEAGAPVHEEAAPGTKPGSAGCVTPGCVLKVVDLETGKLLGPNQRGEIRLKGPNLMKGYVGVEPSEYLDEEGFFKTGDVGYYDDEKYFFIVDRVKELIKFDSFQVAPAELEAVLIQHSAVSEAGVVGKPHPQYGEAPTAFVVLRPGEHITEDELMRYVDGEVSSRMRLAGGIRFVASLPRNNGGKLLRKELKELL